MVEALDHQRLSTEYDMQKYEPFKRFQALIFDCLTRNADHILEVWRFFDKGGRVELR